MKMTSTNMRTITLSQMTIHFLELGGLVLEPNGVSLGGRPYWGIRSTDPDARKRMQEIHEAASVALEYWERHARAEQWERIKRGVERKEIRAIEDDWAHYKQAIKLIREFIAHCA